MGIPQYLYWFCCSSKTSHSPRHAKQYRVGVSMYILHPPGIIPTENSPENLLCVSIRSFKTIDDRGVRNEGHRTNDQELTGTWLEAGCARCRKWHIYHRTRTSPKQSMELNTIFQKQIALHPWSQDFFWPGRMILKQLFELQREKYSGLPLRKLWEINYWIDMKWRKEKCRTHPISSLNTLWGWLQRACWTRSRH